MHAYLYNATTPQQNKIFAYIIIHIIIIIIIMNLWICATRIYTYAMMIIGLKWNSNNGVCCWYCFYYDGFDAS